MQTFTVIKKIKNGRLLYSLLGAITVALVMGAVSEPVFGAKPFCGNEVCEGNEPRTCPTDCQSSPPPNTGVESCGCGRGLPASDAKAGRTYLRELTVAPGLPPTQYQIRLPGNYDVNAQGGIPVLLYLHGWGGSFRSLPASVARHAKTNGYIVVSPTGYGDGGRNSWNGFRSARLPNCISKEGYSETDCDAGPRDPGLYSDPSTCVDIDNAQFNYCYDSCKDASGVCPKWNGANGIDNTWGSDFNGEYTCYWTTCLDSVAQIEAILDDIERDYCIDRSMIWVTGCSNGGMFVYELAKDTRTSQRFAGYIPQVGSPHPGFEQYTLIEPPPPKFFMGFWGETDTTVPGRANFPSDSPQVALDTNFNGWLYMPARDITRQWATMNGLSGDPVAYDARKYSSSLECNAWNGSDTGSSEIVECFFQGGHSCPGFGNMPQMIWDFAKRHPKAQNEIVPGQTCP